MPHQFTDEDRGRPVRNDEGERIATVTGVQDGHAQVESDEGITDAIKEKLGWDDDEDEGDEGDGGRTHELSDSAVDRVDDDGVWIRQI